MPDDEVPDGGVPAGEASAGGRPDGEGSGKHIAEQLGGRPGGPLSDEERTERERVRNLIQSVASCYNSLVSTETDPDRKAELGAKLAFYDAEFRRRSTMSAEERSDVLRTYPGSCGSCGQRSANDRGRSGPDAGRSRSGRRPSAGADHSA